MKRRSVFTSFAATVLFASAQSLYADVFSLWPFGSHSVNAEAPTAEEAEMTMAELLGSRKFWNENITVNGQKLIMHIALADNSLTKIRTSIRKFFPDAQTAGNLNSMLVRRVLKNGNTSRIFLLQMDGLNSLLQFSMELPKDMPKECPDTLWPSTFPRLAGASDCQLMSFPKRSSLFATFTVKNAEIPHVLDQLVARLKADGWEPATSEYSSIFEGTGEVFMKEEPSSLLLVGTVHDSSGDVQVSFYHRTMK